MRKDFGDDSPHKSCLGKTLLKFAQMTKGKSSWYSVFITLTLLGSFLLLASGKLDSLGPV